MNAVGSHLVGVTIVVMMLVFVAIWIWAWLPHHKNDFDRLARMPMLDLAAQRSAETSKSNEDPIR